MLTHFGYPASNFFTVRKIKSGSIFTSYQFSPKIKLKSGVKIIENKVSDTLDAKRFEDSVLRSYSTIEKSRFTLRQLGNIYKLEFHNLPVQHTYRLYFKATVDNLVKD